MNQTFDDVLQMNAWETFFCECQASLSYILLLTPISAGVRITNEQFLLWVEIVELQWCLQHSFIRFTSRLRSSLLTMCTPILSLLITNVYKYSCLYFMLKMYVILMIGLGLHELNELSMGCGDGFRPFIWRIHRKYAKFRGRRQRRCQMPIIIQHI